MKSKGITLISIVILVIVLLILSSVSISLILGEQGIITQSQTSGLLTEFAGYKESIEILKTNNIIEENTEQVIEDSLTYNIIFGEEIKTLMPHVDEQVLDKIIYLDNELIYISDEINQETKALETIGYKIVSSSDIEYQIELKMIENLIELSNIYNYPKIGKAVETIEYTESIYIAGNKFGSGWNVLGDGDGNGLNSNVIKEIEELDKFILSEKEKSYFKNSPYLLNYTQNNYVLSINGKEIVVNGEEKKYIYSYNYDIPVEYISNNIFAAVTQNAEKTVEQYGEFYSTNKDNDLEYNEDKYGHTGLILGENSVSMPINDNDIHVNEEYSLSVLVEGTTNQINLDNYAGSLYPDGNSYFGGTIIAISSGWDKYTAWLSVANNYLRVYVYSEISIEKGYTYVDISEFDNKFMHILITAKKGGYANLYINGVLKSTFQVDDYTFDNTEITLGDLRPNRGLMYEGTIYDVVVYDRLLTEGEIEYTWNYVKNEYNLDETGTQY